MIVGVHKEKKAEAFHRTHHKKIGYIIEGDTVSLISVLYMSYISIDNISKDCFSELILNKSAKSSLQS